MSDNGWISVDERLPEAVLFTARYNDTNRVLAVSGGLVFIATLRRRTFSARWLDDESFPLHPVTHWQHLPPPPEATP